MYHNIIVALSNFPCMLPLWRSHSRGDLITTAAISFVSVASITSHLVENHKHGMLGIGFSQTTSYLLNRMDVIGCFIIAARLASLYIHCHGFDVFPILKHKWLLLSTAAAITLLRISEYDKYNPELRTTYMVTHAIWHCSIFVILDRFLNDVIY
jgi:hypothetical protein